MTQYTKQLSNYNGVKGWLLLLSYSLMVLSPLYNIYYLSNTYEEISPFFNLYPSLEIVFIITCVLTLLLMTLSIRAGIFLYKVKPGAVKIAKNYLLIYISISIIYIFIPLVLYRSPEANSIIDPEIIIEFIRSYIFFVVWYSYLCISKRVKVTYLAYSDLYGTKYISGNQKLPATNEERIIITDKDQIHFKTLENVSNANLTSKNKTSGFLFVITNHYNLFVLLSLVLIIVLTLLIGNYNAEDSNQGMVELIFLNISFTMKTIYAYVLYFLIITAVYTFFIFVPINIIKYKKRKLDFKDGFQSKEIPKGIYRLFVVVCFIISMLVNISFLFKVLKESSEDQTDLQYFLKHSQHIINEEEARILIPDSISYFFSILLIPIVYYILLIIATSVFKWVYTGFQEDKKTTVH